MAEAPQRFTFSVPEEFDAFDREAVAEDMIRRIQERTEKGVDADGQPFAAYSKSYSESLDFQLAGKSRHHVNLRLTDEMMESLELIAHGRGYVTVGFRSGTEENDKAAWAKAFDNGPSRNFLGAKQEEIDEIVNRYRRANPLAPKPSEVKQEQERLVDRVLKAANLKIFGSRNG